jgi:hypothetical protein
MTRKFYTKSFSQSHQESFVLNILKEKRNGFYLEIGGHDGFVISNTFLLESQFDWSGFALDISRKCVDRYNQQRINPCIEADATKFDYLSYLEATNAPKQIDYLQVDIEPAQQSLIALKSLPLSTYRFSVITFEHDVYASNENTSVKEESQNLLLDNGYKLIVEDVKSHGNAYEDWYVDPSVVDSGVFLPFQSKSIEDYAIFKGAIIV